MPHAKQGLVPDLDKLHRHLTRRRAALGWLASLGGSAWAATAAPERAGACRVIPDETAGPFPANGSGRRGVPAPNALALGGIVRSDVRSSFAGAAGVAQGVPMALTLQLVNTAASCAPLPGHLVYLWQCDREGRYSMYSPGVEAENYLRGVQLADAEGRVSFTSVFPGCYPGRMPHLHFEVYRAPAQPGAAITAAQRIKTSQLAFAAEDCAAIYRAAAGYGSSVQALQRTSFARDFVFSDGVEDQLAVLGGNPQSGLSARLVVGLSG